MAKEYTYFASQVFYILLRILCTCCRATTTVYYPANAPYWRGSQLILHERKTKMSKSNWIIPFTIVDSLNRMFYGMYPTLLGPSLPFLANAVNVDIETINWLQPFGKF